MTDDLQVPTQARTRLEWASLHEKAGREFTPLNSCHTPDFRPKEESQWKNFFRAAPIMPGNPVPSRSTVPGSGTGEVEKIAF
jgi:hypothetical protein